MKLSANASAVIPVVMLPLGLWLGWRAFRGQSLAGILAAVAELPAPHLAAAIACTVASYACLTGFDALGVRYAGRGLPYRKVALTSFVSLSIGHTVGVAVLSSGALRYRLYTRFGLRGRDVVRIVLFSGVTVGLGLTVLGGLALLFRPGLAEELMALGIGTGGARALGAALVAAGPAYVLAAWRIRRPLTLRGHEFRLPTPGIAAAQLAVGTVNFAFVAGALHQLLAAAAPYADIVAAYVLGIAAGLVSHVPGGLGVLEYVISSLIGREAVIAAPISFRILYFLLPLLAGSTLLLATELWRAGRKRR